MAYSDFDLKTAVHKFALTEVRDVDVFRDVEPLEPSEFLRVWLDTFAPVALGVFEAGRIDIVHRPAEISPSQRGQDHWYPGEHRARLSSQSTMSSRPHVNDRPFRLEPLDRLTGSLAARKSSAAQLRQDRFVAQSFHRLAEGAATEFQLDQIPQVKEL